MKGKKANITWNILIIIFFIILIGSTLFYLVSLKKFNEAKQRITAIEIDEKVITDLNNLYENSSNEFVICLKGTIDGNIAKVKDYEVPSEFITSENNILFAECDTLKFLNPVKTEKTLGTIHNHPIGICSLSFTDAYTFGRLNDGVSGIICGVDNVKIYTPNSLIKSIM